MSLIQRKKKNNNIKEKKMRIMNRFFFFLQPNPLFVVFFSYKNLIKLDIVRTYTILFFLWLGNVSQHKKNEQRKGRNTVKGLVKCQTQTERDSNIQSNWFKFNIYMCIYICIHTRTRVTTHATKEKFYWSFFANKYNLYHLKCVYSYETINKSYKV